MRILGRWIREKPTFFMGLLLFLLSFGEQSCDCGTEIQRTELLEVKIVKPAVGVVSGQVEVLIKVIPHRQSRFAELYLIDPNEENAQKQKRLIAELHEEPYHFFWNSLQVRDGHYRLQAIVYDESKGENRSQRIPIQVLNDPPHLWFANCVDGQFIRGIYPLVVNYEQDKTVLKGPPILFLSGNKPQKALERRPPFRFLISTLAWPEGAHLDLVVEAEGSNDHLARIRCRTRVDNTPPTVRFKQPLKKNILLGRQFTVLFETFDRFGVKEVRLWVDGQSCGEDESSSKTKVNDGGADDSSKDGGSNESQRNCPNGRTGWIGRQAPLFPVNVTLSKRYNSERSIILTARAVDLAGNMSDPPAQLEVKIDPISPEIFIRSPHQSAVLEQKISFTARVTDNHLLQSVEYLVFDGKKYTSLLVKNLHLSAWSQTLSFSNAMKRFGYGHRWFVVRAVDASGNQSEKRRLFSIGCVDSTDCPLGKICHQFRCLVPAALNEPCDEAHPCIFGTRCVAGNTPVCSASQKRYCRANCNPGNKFVTADACQTGYFCSKTTRACMPGDGCRPLKGDCGTGRQCVPMDNDSGICVPVGHVSLGRPCQQSCQSRGNCPRGAWCIFLVNIGKTACLKICEVNGAHKCPNSQRCIPLQWSFGGNQLRYGICR